MTIKEVKVELTEADLKAESRPVRRRRTRKVGGQSVEAEESSPSVAAVEKVATASTATTATPTVASTVVSTAEPAAASTVVSMATPTVASTTASVVTSAAAPTVASNTASAGSTDTTMQAGGVHIRTRKRTHGSHQPATPVPSKSMAARILPVKRHATLTKERPKLRIPTQQGGNQPMQAAQAAQAAQATQPSLPVIQATTGGGRRKRRFTERRIGISVKSLKTTRKARKSIRKQVAAMSPTEIRKVLTEKGILKGKSNPPEAMLRSLMTDYLSLKH